ncbi:lactonase family protein [Pedobacter sp. Leaf176]|uniref:lactonase family protein n=1 Tax=Pedobacter sp. Leaf176 TaxID=1736286 RepID=UPI0006FFC076|nr:lactonase family protein [Pedobacter sp. Leaf176]KQR71187.1 hypothetical protein ASF92_07310 [Pedobacter sp. Leaf176]
MIDKGRIDLFIGNYASAEDDSIFRYSFDGSNGQLKLLSSVGGIENPSYLIADHRHKLLFAISEKKEGTQSKMASFIVANEQQPIMLSEVSFEGAGACHISIHTHANMTISSNYGGGSLAVLPFDSQGKLAQPVQLFRFDGSGPNQERQEQAHIHSSLFSPDHKMLFVADLGSDRIYTYHYNQYGVQPLSPTAPSYIDLPGGVGPRQMVFHPSGAWFYVLCELSGDVFVFYSKKFDKWLYRYTIATGDELKSGAEAGGITIDQRGNYLYTSNRGEANVIVVFSINKESGILKEIQRIPAGGEGPRHLAIDPSGSYLFSANEKGNNITSFHIERENGRLTYAGVAAEIGAPTCLQFLEMAPNTFVND